MIKVDISNVWGQIALPDLLAMEKEVAQAHTTLVDGTGAGNDFLGWQNLPTREPTEEILRIQSAGSPRWAPGQPLSCCKAPTTTWARARAIPRSISPAMA